MTYGIHIETLKSYRDHAVVLTGAMQDALDAAIEIMQAAQPKDAAAEREHCVQTLHAFCSMAPGADDVQWLERERAQARAEGYAAGRAENEAANDHYRQTVANLNAVHTKLAAAQAEIERLKDNLVHDQTAERSLNTELSTKLAAAQAEIDRLKDYLDHKEHETKAICVLHSNCVDARNAALTKLANLRSAAERALSEGNVYGAGLRAAIEESKP